MPFTVYTSTILIHNNPHAPRNFKAVRQPFNEYEWGVLEEGCELTGRSKLNLLREALIEYVAAHRDTSQIRFRVCSK